MKHKHLLTILSYQVSILQLNTHSKSYKFSDNASNELPGGFPHICHGHGVSVLLLCAAHLLLVHYPNYWAELASATIHHIKGISQFNHNALLMSPNTQYL